MEYRGLLIILTLVTTHGALHGLSVPQHEGSMGEEGSVNRHEVHKRSASLGTDAASTAMVIVAAVILAGMVIIMLIIFCKMRRLTDRTISPLPSTETALKPPLPPLVPLPEVVDTQPPQTPVEEDQLEYPPPPYVTPTITPAELKYSTQTLRELSDEIVSLTRPIIAELRSYSSPPLPVHRTMRAVYILLGEKEKEVRHWNNILILLSSSGGKSLSRRIREFTTPDERVVREARKVVRGMRFEDVQGADTTVTCLYAWVSKICGDSK